MTERLNLGRLASLAAMLVIPAAAWAHEGDIRYLAALHDAYDGPRLDVGQAGADEAVRAVVALAGRLSTETAPWLLPPGTRVDRVAWAGHVAQIELTVPRLSTAWRLSETDLETLTSALDMPFAHNGDFGGVNIRVRVDGDTNYGTLASLLPPEPAPAPDNERPDADFVGLPQELFDLYREEPRVGGPTVNAAGQPTGALTGVTLFVAGGHGWTAGASSWLLQREVLLGMCEDYGNIDMINYFTAYAFNAGATVVPMRPVGWQPIEVVLDQDDPGVTYTGAWSPGSSSKYYENGVTNSGIVYMTTASSPTETATARYAPNIVVTDYYPVYCFTVAADNRAIQTYRIKHSGGVSEVSIDHRLVGSGWIWLGNYHFVAGEQNYVEITNKSTVSGAIIADAIRWGGGTGDIVRPGPNSISGYPRDEECQRYWGQSEWGNHAVGFDSGIWDTASDDQSDNVGTGARIGREMNIAPAGGVLVDRWKRAYIEFHTNASDGSARGQICLITTTGATTNQTLMATTISNEVDNDLQIVDDDFEFTWYNRSEPTLTGAYGAISTTNNGNEFDATLCELAFHDNATDAQLLRDDRVRAAAARAAVQGMIRFLNGFSGSQVPLAFAPDVPVDVRAIDAGGGDVTVAWDPPASDAARGDPATGYVVYQSSNGFGWGNPVIVGNVLSTTISGVAVGETRFFRVAARNAGGESMPSEALAVRRPATGVANVLVVNGFDRLRRDQNPIQTFTQPPAYAGRSIERQIWRRSNSYDYVVEYANALAADGYGFSSCSNEAVIAGQPPLANYDVVIWALGNESFEDHTLTPTEQSRLSTYLNNGGKLFISGADIGFDLIGHNSGVSFMLNTLKTSYLADDADTYTVTGIVGGIFEGLGPFSFSQASGARYDVPRADILTSPSPARTALGYVGGSGGAAAVQYAGATYNVVVFGFPFEALSPASARATVLDRVMTFLLTAGGPVPFDLDGDGYVDIDDFYGIDYCWQGPDVDYLPGDFCLIFDPDHDLDVDMTDFARFQAAFTGPPPGP